MAIKATDDMEEFLDDDVESEDVPEKESKAGPKSHDKLFNVLKHIGIVLFVIWVLFEVVIGIVAMVLDYKVQGAIITVVAIITAIACFVLVGINKNHHVRMVVSGKRLYQGVFSVKETGEKPNKALVEVTASQLVLGYPIEWTYELADVSANPFNEYRIDIIDKDSNVYQLSSDDSKEIETLLQVLTEQKEK